MLDSAEMLNSAMQMAGWNWIPVTRCWQAKARHADSSQLTLVFDDWEAFAGNSFASSEPNNNADQWHNTLRWAANHPWIELVNLKDVLDWATNDSSWVIDQGYVYDKSMQTYEWLKHAAEHNYDHWYYGRIKWI